MQIKHLTSMPLNSKADMLAITLSGDISSDVLVKAIDKDMDGRLLAQVKTEGFEGKAGQSLLVHPGDAMHCGILVLIGSGKNTSDPTALRNVAAYAYKAARRLKIASLELVMPATNAKNADMTGQMMAEGVLLGSYKFTKYLTDEKKCEQPVETVGIYSERGTGKKKKASRTIKDAIQRGAVVGQAICHARDMVNEPAEFLNPAEVARIGKALAKKHKSVTTKVLSEKECEKLGMGLFLAVGRGSARRPQFIHMTYTPKKKAKKVITFVGKGVTFDSGGYSLKPSAAMVDMKIDMAGCAAVVSSMDAIATLGSDYEIHIITACCENLVSSNAYLLGDVITGMNGTTVEITNTDAEGRLTLADALTYAQEKTSPDELFDFATLTGACMVALGGYTAGVLTNNNKLVKTWLKAADTTGEDMWQLPLRKKLKSQIKTPIADLKNSGLRWGGAITAGLFLEHFVKDTAWVHVDLAGPAYVSKEQGATMRGATGFAVATIIEHATR